MTKDDGYKGRIDRDVEELDYGTRAGFWYTNKWVWGVILSILVIVVVLWGLGVFSSGIKGAGDAHKTNQSGTNRIAKQEMFQQLYQDIQVADTNVDNMFNARESDPSYPNKVNYTGSVSHCNQLVGNYNAEAKKYTSQDWKDNELPSEIDKTDPKFDCKENTK